MKKNSTVIPVVAAALVGSGGRILLQKRRADAEHGGLWEFPGGKIDPGESPESALVREIEEELAIRLAEDSLVPLAFASERVAENGSRGPYVILLYICRSWAGDPRCLDGEEVAWFAPEDLAGLAMPPLDVPLAQALIRAI